MWLIKKIIFVGYGFFLSAIIGLIAAGFLIIENFLTESVWSNNNQILQTILILIGSGILYYLLRQWPNLPRTAQESLQELRKNKTIDYQDVFSNLLVTLVILTYGAGVGPEAALLSAIISLSIWQADNMRYFYFNYDKLKSLPMMTRLKRLLNPFKYRQRYDQQKVPKIPNVRQRKLLLYILFSLNGILAFAILLRQTDQPSFVTNLGQSHWQWPQLWLVPVLMLVSIIFTVICKMAYSEMIRIASHLKVPLASKVFIGTLGIIAVSYLAPDLLFSGQHSLHLLIGEWSHKTPLFLMTMAVLKLLFLVWCLNLQWRGGDIFPITFAAITLGFAAAGILSGFDSLLIVAIVATTITSELASPIIAGIFLLFFFPITLSPIIIVIAAILFLKNKYLPKLKFQIKKV